MSQKPSDEMNELFSSLLRLDKNKFNRCLEPSMECENNAIRAHSVQNARILDNLVCDGHVVMFKRSISKEKGPQIELGLVGRNSATTFTGLCATHDQEIFSAVDNETFDLKEKRHLFLVAYRSVTRELYATMDAVIKEAAEKVPKMSLTGKIFIQ